MSVNIEVNFFLERAQDERRRALLARTPALADLHERLSALYVGLAEAQTGLAYATSRRDGCAK